MWEDHEELKESRYRSDRYIIIYHREYSQNEDLKKVLLETCARVAGDKYSCYDLKKRARKIMLEQLGYVVKIKPKYSFMKFENSSPTGIVHYSNNNEPCLECGELNYDSEGVGHYRG